jgi:hypothetical protein
MVFSRLLPVSILLHFYIHVLTNTHIYLGCAPIALFGSLEIDNEQSEASLRRLPSLVSIPDSLVSTGNYETAPSSPMEGNVMAEKDDAFEVGFEY